MQTDDEFGSDHDKRRRAISAYYALCTMIDDHVGAICAALDDTGLAGTTTVIYASDHGEALGQRGHWGKSNLYGECTQVPLVMAGPDVPAGRNLRHTGQSHRSCADFPFGVRPCESGAFPAARCSRLPTRHRTRSVRAFPSITRSGPRPAHSCCARGAGSITSISAMRPSCSMSIPIRMRRSTGPTIRPVRTSLVTCAAIATHRRSGVGGRAGQGGPARPRRTLRRPRDRVPDGRRGRDAGAVSVNEPRRLSPIGNLVLDRLHVILAQPRDPR